MYREGSTETAADPTLVFGANTRQTVGGPVPVAGAQESVDAALEGLQPFLVGLIPEVLARQLVLGVQPSFRERPADVVAGTGWDIRLHWLVAVAGRHPRLLPGVGRMLVVVWYCLGGRGGGGGSIRVSIFGPVR